MSHGPARPLFLDCVEAAWLNRDLMAQYRRLYGSTLGLGARTAIERMIDDATGAAHVPADFGHFLWFVQDIIWSRLPGEVDPADFAVAMVLGGTNPRGGAT